MASSQEGRAWALFAGGVILGSTAAGGVAFAAAKYYLDKRDVAPGGSGKEQRPTGGPLRWDSHLCGLCVP